MKNPNKWIFFKFVAKSTSSFVFLTKRFFEFFFLILFSAQVPVHNHWCFKIQSQAKFRLGSSNWKSNVIEFNQAWNPQRTTNQNLQCQNNLGCKFFKCIFIRVPIFGTKSFSFLPIIMPSNGIQPPIINIRKVPTAASPHTKTVLLMIIPNQKVTHPNSPKRSLMGLLKRSAETSTDP